MSWWLVCRTHQTAELVAWSLVLVEVLDVGVGPQLLDLLHVVYQGGR